MRRVLVYDRFDAFLFELTPAEVFGLVRSEEVNGEHSLEITTTRVLDKGSRVLMQDDQGTWREYVVYGTDALHGAPNRPVGTYYCAWSLQHDLTGAQVSRMPGVQTPVTAAVALEAALSGTSRWSVGTVTVTSTGGASMYDMSSWEALSVLIATWGGEVDAQITVDGAGVASRSVALYAHQGASEATRRFDFGSDITSVRRKIADGPMYCRISPRGMGEQTESGGYGRKITIESVNDGKDYLENAAMVDLAKLPDGSGGWEYPTVIAENPEIQTPADLLAWGESVLEKYTVPKITYEVEVVQASAEGVDAFGVALGDAVHVVDRKFGDEGLRLSSRVKRMVVDELQGRNIQVTLGEMSRGLSDVVSGMLGSLQGDVNSLLTTVMNMNGGSMSTADYLSNLIARLNAEINATGGYTYITEGYGIRTYDRAVTDPLVGAEATAVVEIKGGTVRIANSKTSSGDWVWKTVFTSGHVAADVVTAANIVTGFIGSTTGNYWDLDNGILQIVNSSIARVTADGLLIGIAGYPVGALVRSTGAYDIVKLTWQNGEPTVGDSLTSHYTLLDDAIINLGNDSAKIIRATNDNAIGSDRVEEIEISATGSTAAPRAQVGVSASGSNGWSFVNVTDGRVDIYSGTNSSPSLGTIVTVEKDNVRIACDSPVAYYYDFKSDGIYLDDVKIT